MSRAVAGRLNGVYPPIGTLVGPNWHGEPLVVVGHDERGVVLGYPTSDEVFAALSREDRRSLTEVAASR